MSVARTVTIVGYGLLLWVRRNVQMTIAVPATAVADACPLLLKRVWLRAVVSVAITLVGWY
jgi:hypothetical protein